MSNKKDDSQYEKIDTAKIKTYSIKNRKSKVSSGFLAGEYKNGMSFSDFVSTLPEILVARDFRLLVDKTAEAVKNDRAVILMMGAHVIKCGLSPVIIDLMKNGIISAIAWNGACAIHDFELAYYGQTSEDVASALKDGSFGMVEETSGFINRTISDARVTEMGYGEALGRKICESDFPNKELSVVGNAYSLKIPLTVHVAIGTDIIHQHPNADGAAIGELSMRDFHIFAASLKNLGNGGVVLHFGSAVILPELFLKALSVARNLGYDVHKFTTANFDMIQHYRPGVNIVHRPTEGEGTGLRITGHHEIMLPLFAAALKEKIA